jgi:hypothetical protein
MNTPNESNRRLTFLGLFALLVGSILNLSALDIGPMEWTPRADWINVKSYAGVTKGPNAVGDGVADDTAALQAVLTSVQAYGHKTIYFPPGTYKISNTLKIHDVSAVYLLGCGSKTILSWAGPSGGAMFLPSATHHMRYLGLTWEGNNLASCAYEHASQANYETVIQHENESFRNFTAKATYSFLDSKGNTVTTPVPPTAAILSGFPTTSGGGLTGETMVYNCSFHNCTMGIVQAWDVGNNFMWHVDSCQFEDCDFGINFFNSGCNDVTNCHFEKSKTCDVMGGHSMHVLHCTSQGSVYFYSSLANCPLSADALEDCWVDGWSDPTGAVHFPIPGPNVIFDCTFTHPPQGAQPPINLKPLTNLDPHLLLSNNYEPGVAATALVNTVKSKLTFIPPGLRGGVITSSTQTFLQTSYPAESTHIIDVTQPPYSADGSFKNDAAPGIQAAIAAAQKANDGSIVYIPNGMYKIGSTLTVPSGNYSLEGEGFAAQLNWMGAKDGTLIVVPDPQNMSVKLLRLCVADSTAGIRVTASGPCSVTIDEIRFGGLNLGNPGASGDNNDGPGIVLSNLPAGSKVYLPHVDSPITAQNCGAAQVFFKYLAIGEIHVSGTAPKTGFLGACVLEGGQQSINGTNISVNDNQDLAISGYYSEQCGNDLSILGGAGGAPGRVSILGFLSASGNNNGSGGATTSINVNNYRGRLFYGSSVFGDYNGTLPVQVTQTGTNPVDLILAADTFSHSEPTIKTEAGANLIGTLNINDGNYPGAAMTDVPNPLTPASGLSIAQGLDHLRQLEAVDLSVQDGIVTNGPPVAQYAFENDVLDMTGNNNGTNHGATFTVGAIGANAAQFNGTYIEIPKSISADFSIAMWVRTTDTGIDSPWYAGKGLVDGSTGKDAADFGTALNAGKFSLGIGNPDTTLTSTVPINDGNWHHVVATRDAKTGAMRIFVDGAANAKKTGPTGVRDAMPNLHIGGIQSGASAGFFNGAIDQVQIYDYVLTPEQVAYLYDHTRMLIAAAH